MLYLAKCTLSCRHALTTCMAQALQGPDMMMTMESQSPMMAPSMAPQSAPDAAMAPQTAPEAAMAPAVASLAGPNTADTPAMAPG